jgi:hypothetical protein
MHAWKYACITDRLSRKSLLYVLPEVGVKWQLGSRARLRPEAVKRALFVTQIGKPGNAKLAVRVSALELQGFAEQVVTDDAFQVA